MPRLLSALALLLISASALAEPEKETVLRVFFSVVQIHVENKEGEHGAGSGIVVSPNHIATNCHVIANARGVVASQGEENYAPVALKADWKHDLCLLKFDQLPLKAITLGDSSALRYEQSSFSLAHSSGSVYPLLSIGSIKALYPLDNSNVIRTSARFTMGASGSALFDDAGNLIGLNTFKSPGRNGFFYALPVNWIKTLLNAPEIAITTPSESPFWDAPENQRPFFMQIVLPLQNEDWKTLKTLTTTWTEQEKTTSEAWYYLGLAEHNLGNDDLAAQHFNTALQLNPENTNALFDLGLLEAQKGQQAEVHRVQVALNAISGELAETFSQAAGCKNNAC